jgi:hypothetical protein
MYTNDHIDYKTPIDYLEPEEKEDNLYREAATKYLTIMSLTIGYILNSSDTLAAAYGVAYALGLGSVVDGKSMLAVSKEINVSTGTISNHAKNVRLITGLPPSSLMLDLERVDLYREARNQSLK